MVTSAGLLQGIYSYVALTALTGKRGGWLPGRKRKAGSTTFEIENPYGTPTMPKSQTGGKKRLREYQGHRKIINNNGEKK